MLSEIGEVDECRKLGRKRLPLQFGAILRTHIQFWSESYTFIDQLCVQLFDQDTLTLSP